MRKLATIKRVKEVRPIEGADNIELIFVGGWQVVAQKGLHQKDDFVVYCEIDSFLPVRPEFEFLRRSSFRKLGDKEGFRLRTIKLRGQLSQGLVLPMDVLPVVDENGVAYLFEEGGDVSQALGITKYEEPIPTQLAGKIKGNFPTFIPKTDEERVQNLEALLLMCKGKPMYVTEKLDGSSVTFYIANGNFGVCSRNIDLIETEDNAFWKAARAYDIENKLRAYSEAGGGNVAIQGELIGEGIQGNKYKLKGHEVRFFNVYSIDEQKYASLGEFFLTMDAMELKTVPVLATGWPLPGSVDEILAEAVGKSELNSQTEREGIVIRSRDKNISFKAISNAFLLAEK